MYSAPLKISSAFLPVSMAQGRTFDMTKICAFAICTRGQFTIKILNEEYSVSERCVVACLPFVSLEVVWVIRDAEVTFCSVLLEDIPNLINRWINNDNLVAIQQHPVVQLVPSRYKQLLSSIDNYKMECAQEISVVKEKALTNLQRDIIICQSRLIVAQVVRSFLTNIDMKGTCASHRDVVFQRFLFALYANFREHRDVAYYAMRSGLSLKYFSTIIRQLSGTTPSQWVETVVSAEAKTLLNEPHRTIKEIASILNFPDAPTFTKYFARVTGTTPKAYRQSHK